MMRRYRVKIAEDEGEYQWIKDNAMTAQILGSENGERLNTELVIWEQKGDKYCKETKCGQHRYTLSDRPVWAAAI